MLNSTFIDSLESDIELLERLNHFSRLLPGLPDNLGLAPVDVLVIAPSQPIDEIAALLFAVAARGHVISTRRVLREAPWPVLTYRWCCTRCRCSAQ